MESKGKQEIIQAVLQVQSEAALKWKLVSQVQDLVTTQLKSVKQEITATMDNKINKCDVYGEVQEQAKRAANIQALRIGGIEGWPDGSQADRKSKS